MDVKQHKTEFTKDVELFAGAGGFSIGLHEAGFQPISMYELDHDACETLRNNRGVDSGTILGPVFQADLTQLDWLAQQSPVRLLAAGVPCQPFSQAGNHKGQADYRNLFPKFLEAVRCLRPDAVLVENVSGLSRDTHSRYFKYVRMQLEFPSLGPGQYRDWIDHYLLLDRNRNSPRFVPEYHVHWKLLDAADYGAPQRRRRVFIVAIRSKIGDYEFPSPTHSGVSLQRDQSCDAYWDRHGIAPRFQPPMPNSESKELKLKPWATVRDALSGLGDPAASEANSSMNHWAIPGAKSYRGHTGSDLDTPSKAIKAGTHGVSGGENTLICEVGGVRYYTLREMARMQTFPDEHFFSGTRSSVIRQIGNALPPILAKKLPLH